MSEERKHHEYSPSTLQNLEACPSWEGNQTSHPRAIAGTRAHKVTETLVDDNLLSDDDAEAAAECMGVFHQRRQLMEVSGPVTELAETYLPVDAEVFPDGMQATTAGYFDRAIINHAGTYAEAMDFKFGVWRVEKAETNLQGIAYCLGLFRAFPKLESIRFFFLQPALNFVSDAVFTRDQIPDLYLRVKTVVARAREARSKRDFATARPSVAACIFCRHIAACPKVADFALKVGKKFAPLMVPASITPTMIQDEKNTGLGMQLAQVLKVWSDAFRALTADRVLRGAPLPEGYILVSREGSRKVIDPFKFKVRALEAGLSEEEFDGTKKISLGAVEQAIADKMPRGEKKSAVQQFKASVEEDKSVEKGNGACFLQSDND